jgi:hypothetical protein
VVASSRFALGSAPLARLTFGAHLPEAGRPRFAPDL